mmetsp:Transcript_33818/g.55835  ORF Transcript_33818/g.55835 Transcript_33818/m.55835 type:complete len:107 (-) Transcript_33818:169-489(-)
MVLSRADLAAIQNKYTQADGLTLEPEMHNWTAAQAHTYFETNGRVRPDAEEVSRQAKRAESSDANTPLELKARKGPKTARRDFMGLLCPCGLEQLFLPKLPKGEYD